MKNWRNLVLFIAFLGFCVWYGGSWAYKTQYQEPRKKLQAEITKAEQIKTQYESGIKNGTDTLNRLASQKLYHRSLPTDNANTLYHSWLLAAGENCRFEYLEVSARGPRRTQSASYTVSFQLNAQTSLDDLSRFLYEFYWAPFIHRITSLDILPVDNADLVDVEMQIEGLSLLRFPDNVSPYPLRNQLPDIYWRRLSSGLLETYTEPIDSRNLLQFSRGGVDASDFARLTGIITEGGEPEFWFNNQLENRTVRVKLNEQFRIGSFIGKIVEIVGDDIILETTGTSSRGSMRWFLGPGELLKDAIAVPF